jgi:hypothetical protein
MRVQLPTMKLLLLLAASAECARTAATLPPELPAYLSLSLAGPENPGSLPPSSKRSAQSNFDRCKTFGCWTHARRRACRDICVAPGDGCGAGVAREAAVARGCIHRRRRMRGSPAAGPGGRRAAFRAWSLWDRAAARGGRREAGFDKSSSAEHEFFCSIRSRLQAKVFAVS